jgi:hypothetical protein
VSHNHRRFSCAGAPCHRSVRIEDQLANVR